jgi:CRP-like cAMP-binding protein
MMDLLEMLRHDPGASRADDTDACVAFDGWDERDLGAIVALGRRERLTAAEVLVHAGAADRDLFIVLEGELEAFRSKSSGDRRVAVIKPGGLIGEMAFIDGRARSASVRALVPSEVLRIRAADVQVLCRTDPALGLKLVWEIAKILSMRVRHATEAI